MTLSISSMAFTPGGKTYRNYSYKARDISSPLC